jgi:hypothetical protein
MIDKFIPPHLLLDLIWNTAPFLRDRLPPATAAAPHTLVQTPDGFLAVLAHAERLTAHEPERLLDYFALCLAAHHATVASYVPTDVDSKIRGLLWKETRDPAVLARMVEIALAMRHWTLNGISTRWDDVHSTGPVSGHNGEWLSVLAGALGRNLVAGTDETIDLLATAIDEELEREALAFRLALATPGQEIITMRLAMSVTHNLGDLDQGISFWEEKRLSAPYREKFARLAHENKDRYQGTFQIAAHLYRTALSTEGHRHYPLREVKALRRSPDLLLPLSPFLDDWGALAGRHPALEREDRAQLLEALVVGCKKVPNQHGYYRALAGFQQNAPREFAQASGDIANSAQKLMRDGRFRQLIAVPRPSFESMMRKNVIAARAL